MIILQECNHKYTLYMKECANLPRGKQSVGLLTQQKVLRAAVALFLEKGYTKTMTGEIARVAGFEVLSAKQ